MWGVKWRSSHRPVSPRLTWPFGTRSRPAMAQTGGGLARAGRAKQCGGDATAGQVQIKPSRLEGRAVQGKTARSWLIGVLVAWAALDSSHQQVRLKASMPPASQCVFGVPWLLHGRKSAPTPRGSDPGMLPPIISTTPPAKWCVGANPDRPAGRARASGTITCQNVRPTGWSAQGGGHWPVVRQSPQTHSGWAAPQTAAGITPHRGNHHPLNR